MNICMECGHEWEEKGALICPSCGCADFDNNEMEEE